jgi:hypothetical protein
MDGGKFIFPGREIRNINIVKKVPGVSIPTTAMREITLSPNPVRDLLTLRGVEDQEGQVDIFDLKGARYTAMSFSGKSRYTFPVETLPPGLYLLRIMTHGSSHVLKFFKSN